MYFQVFSLHHIKAVALVPPGIIILFSIDWRGVACFQGLRFKYAVKANTKLCTARLKIKK